MKEVTFMSLFWLFAASALATPMEPPAGLMATCHFADNSLITIAETIDKLIIQLEGVESNDTMAKDETVRQSIQSLNETYRSLVTRLANVSAEQNPLPVLKRMRRSIKETIDNVTGSDVAEATTKNSGRIVGLSLSKKWRDMINTCLQHYRILKRIIMFERFLQGGKVYEDESLEEDGMPEKFTWMQVAACKLNRRLNKMGKAIEIGISRVLANKMLVGSLIVLALLYVWLSCSNRNDQPTGTRKVWLVKA